jgi:hypothetical protein
MDCFSFINIYCFRYWYIHAEPDHFESVLDLDPTFHFDATPDHTVGSKFNSSVTSSGTSLLHHLPIGIDVPS